MTREEEILNALRVLQEECKKHKFCEECLLSKSGECCVSNEALEAPSEWRLDTTWNIS